MERLATAPDLPFTVKPFDAPLGAEVSGLDCAQPLTPATVAALEAAWDRHLVLVLHDQRLSDDRLLAFSRNFGDLDPPGPNPYGEPFLKDYPEINVISNVMENDRPIGNLGDGEAVWHADMTYVDIPPKAAILHALEVPPTGGDTWFADMVAAYEALPEALRARIDGRVLVHDAAHNSAGMLRRGYREVTDVRDTPGARHPIARTDRQTGRRSLFLGRRPHAYVVGMDVADSEALLDALWEHVADPRFAMRHRWHTGDLLMWRNLNVLHRRDAFDPASRRIMHRTQIKGDQPIV
jgi:taurine dioxygenase